MTKILLILVIIFLQTFSSCRIDGTLQGLTSYYNKTIKKSNSLLVYISDSEQICNTHYSDSVRVIVLNDNVLKECIKNYEHTIVYIWSPKCKSKLCYPISLVQDSCYSKGLELFVIAEYYDFELMSYDFNLYRPIYGIDTKYYNTNLVSKYLKKFKKGLTSTDSVTQRILYFKKGVFVNSFNNIQDMP